MQVPEALNIVTAPVLELTVHAFEFKCEKVEIPSPALTKALSAAVEPYFKVGGDPEILNVRLALENVKVRVELVAASKKKSDAIDAEIRQVPEDVADKVAVEEVFDKEQPAASPPDAIAYVTRPEPLVPEVVMLSA